ncbi:MAG: ABC transporter ATP-binding protein, partial [Gemmobacter sp.]
MGAGAAATSAGMQGGAAAKLSIRGVGKRFGALEAVAGCSIDIAPGTIVSIVGPSGCGKTTLLWMMSGLHQPTEGQILLDGTPVTGPRPEIGIVFQEANLLPWRNLIDNIHFPFEIKGLRPETPWIEHLLERVGLRGFERRFPRELSGGMQQRAAIVRALALRPSVLLMDEPFGALDAQLKLIMQDQLQKITQHQKMTVLFVTHDLAEAIAVAYR